MVCTKLTSWVNSSAPAEIIAPRRRIGERLWLAS